MAFDFPAAPVDGQEFTPPGGPTYVFKDPTWTVKTSQVPSDAYVKKAGDVMTGALTLPGNPANALEAATKQYVDANAGGGANPLHVLKAGDTMTGNLKLFSAIPTITLDNDFGAGEIVGSRNGSTRWKMHIPSGGVADFAISRYGDNGVQINAVLNISRADGLMTYRGDVAITKVDPGLRLDKSASGQSAGITARMGGNLRWGLELGNGIAEAGANVGSNFGLHRYDDAGNFIATVLDINRADGLAKFGGNVRITKATPQLVLDKPVADQSNNIYGLKAGLGRWQVELGNGTPETGSNAGSDFYVNRYSDAGGYLGSPIMVDRAGLISFNDGRLGFPATQSPSAAANVLDDYEEGQFTPTVAFGGVSTGITYGSQFGYYVKVGQNVTFQLRVVLSNKGAAVGALSIEGLPFPIWGTFSSGSVGHLGSFGSLTGGVTIIPQNTSIIVNQFSATGVVAVSNANLSNISDMIVAGSYRST